MRDTMYCKKPVSQALNYIHLPDAELEHLLGININVDQEKPIDSTVRSQAVFDIKRVLEARRRGQGWAWKMSAFFHSTSITSLLPLAKMLHNMGWRIIVTECTNTAIFFKKKISTWVMSDIDALTALKSNKPDVVNYVQNQISYIDLVAVLPVEETGQPLIEEGIRGKRFVITRPQDFKLITDFVMISTHPDDEIEKFKKQLHLTARRAMIAIR